MFGDMMGDLQKKQDVLKEKLRGTEIKESHSDGSIVVTGNANKEITNINISQELLGRGDKEEMEDLLLITVNKVLDKAGEIQAIESESMISDILPGGLGNLFG